MSYILNSCEVLFHIPNKGITKKALKEKIMRIRNLSVTDTDKSIERALLKKTVVEENGLLKPSPSIMEGRKK